MVTNEYGTKLEGFYLIGFFEKGRKGQISIEKQKPFVTDENGHSSGKCFPGFRTNCFPTNWFFFETDIKIKDIHKDKNLKEWIDETWKEWCKKHKRKFESIWEEHTLLTENEEAQG